MSDVNAEASPFDTIGSEPEAPVTPEQTLPEQMAKAEAETVEYTFIFREGAAYIGGRKGRVMTLPRMSKELLDVLTGPVGDWMNAKKGREVFVYGPGIAYQHVSKAADWITENIEADLPALFMNAPAGKGRQNS